MLIYLAHPIDKHRRRFRTELDQQISYLRHSLKGSKHHLYHPGGGFVVGKNAKVDTTIEAINRVAQDQADGLLVLLPKGSQSWGVPAEIERARLWHQPVAIISDETPTWAMPQPSDPLAAWFKPDSGNYAKAIKYLEDHAQYKNRTNNRLYWKQLSEKGRQPTKAYLDDAGFDLYVSERTIIPPHEFVDVPTDVAMELPSDSWGLLTGRSSTTRERGLLVNQGIIDTGYRGELYVGVWNLTDKDVTVYAGDRIAQLIVLPNRTAELHLQKRERLSHHERGEQGFGSTGL